MKPVILFGGDGIHWNYAGMMRMFYLRAYVAAVPGHSVTAARPGLARNRRPEPRWLA
jgi:hypothetical protein